MSMSVNIHIHDKDQGFQVDEHSMTGREYWTIRNRQIVSGWTMFLTLQQLEGLKAEIDSALAEKELYESEVHQEQQAEEALNEPIPDVVLDDLADKEARVER